MCKNDLCNNSMGSRTTLYYLLSLFQWWNQMPFSHVVNLLSMIVPPQYHYELEKII